MQKEELEVIEWLNRELLSVYKFKIEVTPNGSYYVDCRKEKPMRLNREAFKSVDEALSFIGGATRRVYQREAELYKKLKQS